MVNQIEADYENETPLEHRKKYGQFFTNARVADFMIEWLSQSNQQSIYDPAFGLGAFYEAGCRFGLNDFNCNEIDGRIIDFWNTNHPQSNLRIVQEDYLKTWGKKHWNIVCNPPYMRFQKFLDRDDVSAGFEENLGVRLSGYTNIASAFLLKSLSELQQGGRLAYLMPLEFLNTGYGTIVKQKLIQNNWLSAIISLRCEKDVFPGVTTSIGIILVDSRKESPLVDFHQVTQLSDLEMIMHSEPVNRIASDQLVPTDKWLTYFDKKDFEIDKSDLVSLDYYGRFSRGIATGANAFFVMTPLNAEKLGIGMDELIPCITKSQQIKHPVFSELNLDQLLKSDSGVLLFSPKKVPTPKSDDYIQFGERNGYHLRFLTKNRNPWYKTEVRNPAKLLFGVFSRDGYKIIKNTSTALNLTCYHGFQPNIFGMNYIDHLFIYLFSATGRKILAENMRKYGDSLDKFEPNDLNQSLVPSPEFFDTISPAQIQIELNSIQNSGKTTQIMEKIMARLLLPLKHQLLNR